MSLRDYARVVIFGALMSDNCPRISHICSSQVFSNCSLFCNIPHSFIAEFCIFLHPSYVLQNSEKSISEFWLRKPTIKLGFVGRKNAMIRLIAERFIKDAEYFAQERGASTGKHDVMLCATIIINILSGKKKLSNLELARCYTLSLGGLRQSRIRQELIAVQEEQTVSRALQLQKTARNPCIIDPSLLHRNTPVYCFNKGLEFGKWEKDMFEN